ncbi:hypothetical protein ACHAXM_010347, partial [Skeletonema potamos]
VVVVFDSVVIIGIISPSVEHDILINAHLERVLMMMMMILMQQQGRQESIGIISIATMMMIMMCSTSFSFLLLTNFVGRSDI